MSKAKIKSKKIMRSFSVVHNHLAALLRAMNRRQNGNLTLLDMTVADAGKLVLDALLRTKTDGDFSKVAAVITANPDALALLSQSAALIMSDIQKDREKLWEYEDRLKLSLDPLFDLIDAALAKDGIHILPHIKRHTRRLQEAFPGKGWGEIFQRIAGYAWRWSPRPAVEVAPEPTAAPSEEFLAGKQAGATGYASTDIDKLEIH